MDSALNAASPIRHRRIVFLPFFAWFGASAVSRRGTLFAGIPAAERLTKNLGNVSGVPAIFRVRNGLYRLGQSHRRRVFTAQIAADSDRMQKSKRQLRWPTYLTLGSR